MTDGAGLLHLDVAHVRIGTPCNSWEDALKEVAAIFGSEDVSPGFLDAILARERTYPTGLPTEPYGVALPHADPEYVYKPQMAVMTLQDPVDFRVMGDPDLSVSVSLVVALALPESHKERQAPMLAHLLERMQDQRWLKQVVEARSASELMSLWNS